MQNSAETNTPVRLIFQSKLTKKVQGCLNTKLEEKRSYCNLQSTNYLVDQIISITPILGPFLMKLQITSLFPEHKTFSISKHLLLIRRTSLEIPAINAAELRKASKMLSVSKGAGQSIETLDWDIALATTVHTSCRTQKGCQQYSPLRGKGFLTSGSITRSSSSDIMCTESSKTF